MASQPIPILTPPPSGGGTLCSPFVDVLPIDGASISVFGLGRNQSTICTTDRISTRGETLQFELGEGPHWDALSNGEPVLCADLSERGAESWPMFTVSALELGIAAVFAFPMKLGAATVGVVDLYSRTRRRLGAHEVSLAALMANRVATAAVNLATQTADDPEAVETATMPSLRREVHQATGMIQAQLEIDTTDAFIRLRAHAFASGRPIDEIARKVVDRSLDFSTLTD